MRAERIHKHAKMKCVQAIQDPSLTNLSAVATPLDLYHSDAFRKKTATFRGVESQKKKRRSWKRVSAKRTDLGCSILMETMLQSS